MEALKNNSFHQFARQLLTRNELQSVFMHLQHHSGFYINLLFYLLWLAKNCLGRVSKRQIYSLLSIITPWQKKVISELKYTHALVAHQDDLICLKIKQLLEIEITKAFYVEQQMLEEARIKKQTLQRTNKQCVADACANILYYCEIKNDVFLKEDKWALTELFRSVFNEIDLDYIKLQLSKTFDQYQYAERQPVQLMWELF